MSNALDLARTFEEQISYNALAGRELKALAHSIGYRLSFFRPMQKMYLTNELVFLNAFMGSAAIRACSALHSAVPNSDIEPMIGEYVSKLLSRWLPAGRRSEYKDRLARWGSIVLDPSDSETYPDDLRALVDAFYVSLTEKTLDEHREIMLTARFNVYMKMYIEGVMSLMQQFYPEPRNDLAQP